jgi:hypothetical protein
MVGVCCGVAMKGGMRKCGLKGNCSCDRSSAASKGGQGGKEEKKGQLEQKECIKALL